jgi:hypothetical protein
VIGRDDICVCVEREKLRLLLGNERKEQNEEHSLVSSLSMRHKEIRVCGSWPQKEGTKFDFPQRTSLQLEKKLPP